MKTPGWLRGWISGGLKQHNTNSSRARKQHDVKRNNEKLRLRGSNGNSNNCRKKLNKWKISANSKASTTVDAGVALKRIKHTSLYNRTNTKTMVVACEYTDWEEVTDMRTRSQQRTTHMNNKSINRNTKAIGACVPLSRIENNKTLPTNCKLRLEPVSPWHQARQEDLSSCMPSTEASDLAPQVLQREKYDSILARCLLRPLKTLKGP